MDAYIYYRAEDTGNAKLQARVSLLQAGLARAGGVHARLNGARHVEYFLDCSSCA